MRNSLIRLFYGLSQHRLLELTLNSDVTSKEKEKKLYLAIESCLSGNIFFFNSNAIISQHIS